MSHKAILEVIVVVALVLLALIVYKAIRKGDIELKFGEEAEKAIHQLVEE